MTSKIDLARLSEQAMQMQTRMPELFSYLSQRDEATAAMVQVSKVLEPEQTNADRYDSLYEDWQRVNDALRPLDDRELKTGHL